MSKACHSYQQRVIDVFDRNHDGEIEFHEFIQSLSIFTRKDNPEAKMKCMFKLLEFPVTHFLNGDSLSSCVQHLRYQPGRLHQQWGAVHGIEEDGGVQLDRGPATTGLYCYV